jgi:hypothetical protein
MLKPHYEPYRVRKQWPEIMMAFTRIPYTEDCRPRIEYRTHAFLTKYVEKSVTDPCAIRLLYDEVCMHLDVCVVSQSNPNAFLIDCSRDEPFPLAAGGTWWTSLHFASPSRDLRVNQWSTD